MPSRRPSLLRAPRRRRLARLGVVGAVAAGVALRFLTTSPLWLDEALSVRIAAHPLGDIAGALRHDGHPPLYYWLLHLWMQAVGEGDAAVRSLSGVVSVATLPFAWRLGDRVGGPRVARWTLVLVALSPFAVRYATEARMYSLVMLLSVLLALALDGLLRRPTWPRAAQVAVVAALLVWTHYWAFYLLGAVGVGLLVRWRLDRPHRPATGRAIAGLVVGGLAFAPWLPVFLDQVAHTGTPWARPMRPTQVAQTTLADLGGGGFAEALLLGTLLAVLVVAAFAHVDSVKGPVERIAPLDVRVLAAVSGATMLLGSGVAWAMSSAYQSRYGAVVAVLVLCIAAVGITALRPTWLQVALVSSAVVLALAALGHNVRDQRTRADDVAAAIVQGAGPDDVVVVCPDQLGPSLLRILDQRDARLDAVRYPDLGDPRIVDWRDYEERNDRADPARFVQRVLARARDRPIWVVWNGGYRTLVGQCEAVVDGLVAARGGGGSAAEQVFGGAFEVANLVHLP